MIQLIYISVATGPMSQQDLLELLESCRSGNAARGITGMLLYRDGAFLQVLEGEAADVDEVYRHILADPRNTGHHLIVREEINERRFPDWTMGFQNLEDSPSPDLEGYTDLLSRDLTPAEVIRHKDRLLRLFLHF